MNVSLVCCWVWLSDFSDISLWLCYCDWSRRIHSNISCCLIFLSCIDKCAVCNVPTPLNLLFLLFFIWTQRNRANYICLSVSLSVQMFIWKARYDDRMEKLKYISSTTIPYTSLLCLCYSQFFLSIYRFFACCCSFTVNTNTSIYSYYRYIKRRVNRWHMHKTHYMYLYNKNNIFNIDTHARTVELLLRNDFSTQHLVYLYVFYFFLLLFVCSLICANSCHIYTTRALWTWTTTSLSMPMYMWTTMDE